MPESVVDRFSKTSEIVYLFAKQQKYYFDLDAIREPHLTNDKRSSEIVRSKDCDYKGKHKGNEVHESFGSPGERTQRDKHAYNQSRTTAGLHENRWDQYFHEKGKNPGDTWIINTKPYSGAHFSTFPLKLIEKPILAGCPPGGTVLDPFGGSGTVAEFCRFNNRNSIIFELNPEYKELIVERAKLREKPIMEFFK